MLIVSSRNGVPIRLTDERWQPIVTRHPEMNNQRKQVLETVADPDIIQVGDYGELLALHFYTHTPLTSKFLVTAYREVSAVDEFVLTAYFTSRPSARRAVQWMR